MMLEIKYFSLINLGLFGTTTFGYTEHSNWTNLIDFDIDGLSFFTELITTALLCQGLLSLLEKFVEYSLLEDKQ